ncbi:MAG: hypothetical protein U0Q12_09090 [Vicinamibacterales bacterium]
MKIPLEIMLRGNHTVFTDAIVYDADDVERWTEDDVAAILKAMLLAIERAQHPGHHEGPPVSLRGMNWIVSPCDGGVAIALEIHSASAVAGPLRADAQALDALITRAVRASTPLSSSSRVH